MFPVVDPSTLRCLPASVQYFPQEGPKAVPFSLDFSGGNGATLDLFQLMQSGKISGIQTLWIDNSQANAGVMTIAIQGSSQVLKIKANTQGYYPIICGSSTVILFSSAGTNIAQCIALNVPVAPAQWATA